MVKRKLTLLTIVMEGLLKEELIRLVKRHGATGFTLTRAEGEGSRGVRARDWEGPNLRLECLVKAEAAEAILEELSERYFDHYAVIAWLSEVSVLRGGKFVEED